jgi:pSer/pThr/pTyr-binding forkhead associated (FHA) protein
MPVIQVNDKQHPLTPGQTKVGGGPEVDVRVSDDAALGLQAVLEVMDDNRVVIRRARDGAAVRVNGVSLVDPTPLMHGDKVEVGGTEILFSEDKKVGATAFVSASDVASIVSKRSGPARATTATGGRIVSLVDGKEYQIPAAGITFGREAGSDVVVAQPEVSRRHATIGPSDGGYTLTDHSTNGVWVNGTRVNGSQLLARADVVRVGGEEFRFYADVAPAASKAPAGVSAPAAGAVPVAPTAPSPAPVVTPPASPAVAAARVEPPTAPAPREPVTKPEPAAPAKAKVEVAPPAEPAPRKAEPSTAPTRPKPPAARPKKEAAGAVRDTNRGGLPAWVWIVLLIVVGAVAYYLGQQGRG